MKRVLIIDDNRDLFDLLREALASEGFDAEPAYDYDSGLFAALTGEYVLVILNAMLANESGLELLKTLRASSTVPVILLSSEGETVDRILGLQIGADDYLVKPFDPLELAARIYAILRRVCDPTIDGEIRVGDVSLSTSRRLVVRADVPVELTAVEFNVLECLLRNSGSIVTRETLAEEALGRPLGRMDRSVDVHVHKVRKKISSSVDERIKTIRGIGYMYAQPQEDLA